MYLPILTTKWNTDKRQCQNVIGKNDSFRRNVIDKNDLTRNFRLYAGILDDGLRAFVNEHIPVLLGGVMSVW